MRWQLYGVIIFVSYSNPIYSYNEYLMLSGRDTCQGDSGGPLMTLESDGKNKRVYVIAGIVSNGVECAQPGFLG